MVFLRLKFMVKDMTDFDIVNFSFLDGRSTSFGVYISKVIRSARVSSHI